MSASRWRTKAHRQLRVLYGHGRGSCRGCPFLVYQAKSRTWTKCAQTESSGGRATDWSEHLPACGLKDDPSRAPAKGGR